MLWCFVINAWLDGTDWTLFPGGNLLDYCLAYFKICIFLNNPYLFIFILLVLPTWASKPVCACRTPVWWDKHIFDLRESIVRAVIVHVLYSHSLAVTHTGPLLYLIRCLYQTKDCSSVSLFETPFSFLQLCILLSTAQWLTPRQYAKESLNQVRED